MTLIAATQRPTQKAMGAGAVRSQMDLRICFRVREPRDVDLILGQGMLKAGWDAHALNAPGKFLVSAPATTGRSGLAPTWLPTRPSRIPPRIMPSPSGAGCGIPPCDRSARWTRAESPESAPEQDNPEDPEEARKRAVRSGKRYARPRPKDWRSANSCALPDGNARSFTGTCASTPKRAALSRSAGDAGALGYRGAVTVSDRPEDPPSYSLARASARHARTRTTGRTTGRTPSVPAAR